MHMFQVLYGLLVDLRIVKGDIESICSSIKEMEINNHDDTNKSNEKISEPECSSDNELSENAITDNEYIPTDEKNVALQKFSQAELNDLIRDLRLLEEGAALLKEHLVSVFKKKNMLSKDTKATFYRNRDKEFRNFFSQEKRLVYCNNVASLMDKLQLKIYRAVEWRLFIDSSKRSLKAVCYYIILISMHPYLLHIQSY